MDNKMAPPIKRRKLLSPAQHMTQHSDKAMPKPSTASFFHGVEPIETAQPPRHVEEVHLHIRKKSVYNDREQLRLLRRQGTAVLSDIISTNSNADVVVAVTAKVDALGSTTALTTAAVTVDIPDLPSLLSTSSTVSVISDDSADSSSSASPTSSPTQSTTDDSGLSATSSSSSSSSAPRPSRTTTSDTSNITSSSTSSASDEPRPNYTASSSSSLNTDDPQLSSQNQAQTESGTGNSVVPASTASTSSAQSKSSTSSSGTAPTQSSTSAYSGTAFDTSASSNSTVLSSTAQDSQSRMSPVAIAGTVSGYTARTGSASSSISANLTTSASESTSGSTHHISGLAVSTSTSRTGSQSTSSTSSVNFAALFLATQSNGDVATLTRSSESYTTTLSDGQTATVSPSATSKTSSRASSSSASGSVTTISSDRSTILSTVFSTETPTSTQDSSVSTQDPSDVSDGVGWVGVAGDGATATSNGITGTSAAAANDSNDDAVAPAGTIAGGVVGGAAGLALVLAIILLFMRRYKKRALLGHRALPANAAGGVGAGSADGPSSGGTGMAERAGLMPFVGAVPALFRHQNRSQKTGSETGERGFQRVAGRKLPSAYSEGMTGPTHKPMSPPPTMPLVSPEGDDRNLSSHSFYRDSDGFYGGDGSPSSPDPFSDSNVATGAIGNQTAEQMIMSPGPQRRPTIHAGKSNVHSPSVATSGTPSWTPSAAAPFARSETPVSLDGSRNSRFTEEV